MNITPPRGSRHEFVRVHVETAERRPEVVWHRSGRCRTAVLGEHLERDLVAVEGPSRTGVRLEVDEQLDDLVLAHSVVQRDPGLPSKRFMGSERGRYGDRHQRATSNIEPDAYANAERLLGQPLTLPLGPGEPESGREFRSLATRHTFGDSWPRVGRPVLHPPD